MLEERWPSMDLVADSLAQRLSAEHSGAVEASQIRPRLQRRLSSSETFSGSRFTADRLIGRMWDYPRLLARSAVPSCDVFHIVDHSYSHLVRALPASRTIVTCHDLDTFRSILEPTTEPRPALFRAMTRRILSGFQMAARIACDSHATRSEIERHGLVHPTRLVVAPLGVDEKFSPAADENADREADALLASPDVSVPLLLHVGSTIARKRILDLLELFARVRSSIPGARLIRVGGPLTDLQRRTADVLGVSAAITSLPVLPGGVLAAVYRRASVVLQPSSAEGFGLPMVEAQACGTPVVASDLPVLREVGGNACEYFPVGDTSAWVGGVLRLLDERAHNPERWRNRQLLAARHASRFTWSEYTRRMVDVYTDVLATS